MSCWEIFSDGNRLSLTLLICGVYVIQSKILSKHLLFFVKRNFYAKCAMYAQNTSKLTNEMHQGEKKDRTIF